MGRGGNKEEPELDDMHAIPWWMVPLNGVNARRQLVYILRGRGTRLISSFAARTMEPSPETFLAQMLQQKDVIPLAMSFFSGRDMFLLLFDFGRLGYITQASTSSMMNETDVPMVAADMIGDTSCLSNSTVQSDVFMPTQRRHVFKIQHLGEIVRVFPSRPRTSYATSVWSLRMGAERRGGDIQQQRHLRQLGTLTTDVGTSCQQAKVPKHTQTYTVVHINSYRVICAGLAGNTTHVLTLHRIGILEPGGLRGIRGVCISTCLDSNLYYLNDLGAWAVERRKMPRAEPSVALRAFYKNA
ncbi:uncharacterized protein B0T23DRAFT_446540 [Neurospora hispaniola]|uniref:Uncharacterized protein n=1 Tax=Neurospora hispaniola TaxID=588809 RepID=A0AAJ0I1J4_9PEZI|nr:hypothetical protein B0T23DRAFT_446540 [Neurospora hispaniola]